MFLLYLLLGFGILLLLWLAARTAAEAQPGQILRAVKWSAGIAGGLFALWLALSGRLWSAVALATWIAPLFMRWQGLLTRFRNLGGPARGQSSGVETAWLRMSLDHDSGAMDGLVLQGAQRGRRLSELSPEELVALLQTLRIEEPDSAAVLEAYLDRVAPTWREREGEAAATGQEARPAGAGGGRMTRAQAYRVLNLEPGADEQAIRDAHRRLMKKVHPDQGGSTFLAAQINEAKDVLLGG